MNQNKNIPTTPRPQRGRAVSGFSLRSDKSGSSAGKTHIKKTSLIESPEDKRRRHMSETTKANPNAAINEAQPIALALEKSTLSSLQSSQWNDVYGNPINDPDRSNPTRWRMERPLETIKSFEVAIDKAYSQRQSVYQSAPPTGYQSQRNSYYGSNNGYDQGSARFSNFSGNNGHYNQSRDSFADGQHGPPPPRHGQRINSDPMLNKYGAPANVYPAVGKSVSKDTINTGASSGSEHWRESPGNNSEVGSVDQANGVARPMMNQQYSSYAEGYAPQYGDDGGNYARGYASRPPMPMQHSQQSNGSYSVSTPAYNGNMGYQDGGGYHNGNGNGYYTQPGQPAPAIPRPPPKDNRVQQTSRPVIQLNDQSAETAKPAPAQRASWLKKRFSRSAK